METSARVNLAFLRLVPKRKDRNSWRLIDSVPKDGTSVLLCKATDADGQPIDWRSDLQTAQVFVQIAAWWGDAWVMYCSQIAEPRLHFEPTHWMPIPLPPCVGQRRAIMQACVDYLDGLRRVVFDKLELANNSLARYFSKIE